MLKIVSTEEQAFENIKKFATELDRSPELQARLPYARSWYAIRDMENEWHFGPSKFIGYDSIDAETYLRTTHQTDGRRTEAQLQAFFKPIDQMHLAYPNLSSALIAFLAKYSKVPSVKMRISIPRARARLGLAPVNTSAADAHEALVKVIVEAARFLPTEHFDQLREQLDEMWS